MNKITEIIRGMRSVEFPSQYWESTDVDFDYLQATRKVIQRDDKTVWDHTMSVIDLLREDNDISLVSGLFHDLGKCCVVVDKSLTSKFPNHDIKSSQIAKVVLQEWGASEDFIDKVIRLVSMHMYDIRPNPTEKAIRQFIAKVGKGNIDNWFSLRTADSCSYSLSDDYINCFIKPFRNIIYEYVHNNMVTTDPNIIEDEGFGPIQIEGRDNP